MPFQLPYMQIQTVLEPELLAAKVRLRTPWATEQTRSLWKPIDDMCDAIVQKHQFSNIPAY